MTEFVDSGKASISGLFPVLPTPMRNGHVDTNGCASLVEHLVPHVHGISILGSMGEGPSLSVEQRMRACDAFMSAVDGRVGVILGVGANAVADCTALAEYGAESGVDALLVPPPSYFAASSAGLADFFRAVADVTDLTLVLYDNPAIAGVLPVPVLATLQQAVPSFRYVKVTDRAHGKVERIRADTALIPLCGSDDMLLHHALAGAVGAMTGAPCVVPAVARRIWDLLMADEIDGAGAVFANQLSPLVVELLAEGDEYPALTKECLKLLHVLGSADVAPPLHAVPPTRLDHLRRALVAAGARILG